MLQRPGAAYGAHLELPAAQQIPNAQIGVLSRCDLRSARGLGHPSPRLRLGSTRTMIAGPESTVPAMRRTSSQEART